jgi:hypothetical protein
VTSRSVASELARSLAREAEAVCRRYLSNGRREGSYWMVGNVQNEPGRSLFVRLRDQPNSTGAAGKWRDAATGERGDLLDIIRETCRLSDFREIADEARRFLNHPQWAPKPDTPPSRAEAKPPGSQRSARRLVAMSQPIENTLAESYLRHRGVTAFHEVDALRFHPRCYYRPDREAPIETWPAMIAAVTDLSSAITGVQRTWLDPSGDDKAPIKTPRRAMGCLLGHGVRFGRADDVMAAGEGIETVLSLRYVMPAMPMIAALSSAHLSAILFPIVLRRLYILRDNDPPGDRTSTILAERTTAAGIEAIILSPTLGDFNDDLRLLGVEWLRAAVSPQLAPQDVARFMEFSA